MTSQIALDSKSKGTYHSISELVSPKHSCPHTGHVATSAGPCCLKIMLMSTRCPGQKQASQGFLRSMSVVVPAFWRANSLRRTFSMPTSLKRTSKAARNASWLLVHSRWIGVTRFNASRNITGCCRSICEGRALQMFSNILEHFKIGMLSESVDGYVRGNRAYTGSLGLSDLCW